MCSDARFENFWHVGDPWNKESNTFDGGWSRTCGFGHQWPLPHLQHDHHKYSSWSKSFGSFSSSNHIKVCKFHNFIELQIFGCFNIVDAFWQWTNLDSGFTHCKEEQSQCHKFLTSRVLIWPKTWSTLHLIIWRFETRQSKEARKAFILKALSWY